MDNLISTIKAHLVTLDGNNMMRALLPLLSLGKVTTRYEPKTKHSPIARIIDLVGQTKPKTRRDLQGYQIMHIRNKQRLKYIS